MLYLVSPDYALRKGPAYDFELDRAGDRSRAAARCSSPRPSASASDAYRTVGTSRAVALASTAPTLEQARAAGHRVRREGARARVAPRGRRRRLPRGPRGRLARALGEDRARREGTCKDGRVILERSLHPQFVSNTFLIADGSGGPAVFIDAGGPVAPLIEAAERLGLTPTPRAADPPPLRPRLRASQAARALARPEGPDQPPRARPAGGQRPPEGGTSSGMETVEAGQTLEFGEAAGPGARTPPGTPPGCSRSCVHDGEFARRRRLHRRHAVQGLGRRRRAPGHSTYADLRDSIMGTLMELPKEHRHPSRSHRRHDGRRGSGRRTPSSASGAGLDPEGSEPCTALGEPGDADPARAPTTTAAPRPGSAGPTGPTTSSRARKVERQPAERGLCRPGVALGPLAWG